MADRQKECERKDLYYDFRCAELEATYFTILKDLPDCFKNWKNGNSIFADYNKFCNSLTDLEKKQIPLILDFDEGEATYLN